ncbi:DUF4142 domain-containing protein [Hymenobacter properus]|uniref:DUF4142 domain-containing protein n=1 Tax=Hymenobacter properus TaxID=2791026 RepID=A0A931BHZ1_9BACT|nr:DUF4142 domain-containing protein [Hymenobacter properus]MBF9142688.1 DUF4142 domain-containing protein [Hymenobacter properus]MBR7721496.1 DUF4142 domain-containing protein [Microvirga sp. SRT04]
MNSRYFAPLFLACLLQLNGCNNEKTNQTTAAAAPPQGSADPLDHFARFFMPLAGCAGIMEVELGKIAAQRATEPRVRDYANQMVKQHTAINNEYRELMRRKGLVPPDTMMREQQLKVDSLQHMSAAEVDRRYTTMMVNDHAMAVKLFDMAYDSAQDAEYREWLGRMRQVVREHHAHALALRTGAQHH